MHSADDSLLHFRKFFKINAVKGQNVDVSGGDNAFSSPP